MSELKLGSDVMKAGALASAGFFDGKIPGESGKE
jgi:hypothetical protein